MRHILFCYVFTTTITLQRGKNISTMNISFISQFSFRQQYRYL